jgi:hypothetical protein
MAREWKSRPASRPTTLTEIARRYHAAAVALAQTLDLSLEEVLTQHRESVTAIFIESSKCEVRLPASVRLPPLGAEAAISQANGQDGKDVSEISETSNGHAIPTTIPADGDLPCAGQEIATLKPAQLAMLLAKVASLVHAEGDGWVPLLHALQAERQARVAQGQRPQPSLVAGDGHRASSNLPHEVS